MKVSEKYLKIAIDWAHTRALIDWAEFGTSRLRCRWESKTSTNCPTICRSKQKLLQPEAWADSHFAFGSPAVFENRPPALSFLGMSLSNSSKGRVLVHTIFL